jgi:hypothetical protein
VTLALIDQQLVRIEPVHHFQGDYSIEALANHVIVRAGHEIVRAGITFYGMAKGVDVDPVSGKFTGTGTIRAVFAGQHLDIEVGQ